jgi:hypothetical protein
MRRLVVVLSIAVGAACQSRTSATATSPVGFDGENRPITGPVASAPAVLTFVSGESQQPVGAAKVTVDGRTYVTGGSGQVAVDRGSREVDVLAQGFMDRRASFSADHFSLWPQQSPTGVDVEYTGRVVYNCTAAGCTDGGEALSRLPDGPVSVVPSRELRNDPVALDVLQEAVQRYVEATRGQVLYTLDARASAAVVIEVGVDASDPAILANAAAGVTRRDHSGTGAISHARITLRNLDLAHRRPLLLHELGHAFGLSHSPRLGDIMWNGPELYDVPDLSSRELLAISLMLQRSSGNRFPDSEGSLFPVRTSSSLRTSIVVD